jgi:hypothetical protein
MKLTDDEKTAHSNVWRTHRELTESLKKSRGKIYSLLLGQCTQVLVDSDPFDPNLLFKLIETFVLKQSNNQYKTAMLIINPCIPSRWSIGKCSLLWLLILSRSARRQDHTAQDGRLWYPVRYWQEEGDRERQARRGGG